MMTDMKKASVKKASQQVLIKATHFDLSEIVMASPKGTPARVILQPAVAPRHLMAKAIVAAVQKVVTERRIDASVTSPIPTVRTATKPAAKPAAKKIVAKPIIKRPAAKKTNKLRGHSSITTGK